MIDWVWWGGRPGRLPGRDGIQVGFYGMNRSLPKRQVCVWEMMFQVQEIARAKAWRCENKPEDEKPKDVRRIAKQSTRCWWETRPGEARAWAIAVKNCNTQSAQVSVQLGEFLQTDHTRDSIAVMTMLSPDT